MGTVALLGTMDSKGLEYAFLADEIRRWGHEVLVIDVGTWERPKLRPDVTREKVLACLGSPHRRAAIPKGRGAAVKVMSRAAPLLLTRLVEEGAIDGVLALGGSGGTSIATAAMRALPVGFPKFMVSTLANGNVARYVGVKDIVMMPSIVDVAGLNRVSRPLLAQAAAAICGMIQAKTGSSGDDRPLIVASMFGNTTACVESARAVLESAGYEVLVFHATGKGGRVMESLIASGLVVGVLDITITEWADEFVGGVFGAGQERLEAAARHGVPAVVVPGCLDMVNFHGWETIPRQFKGRTFCQHNAQVTLMRTNPEECEQLGYIVAEKLNASTGPISVLLPMKGVSVISKKGQPFYDPEADAALFGSLKNNLRRRIPVAELDHAINDDAFANACANRLLEMMRQS